MDQICWSSTTRRCSVEWRSWTLCHLPQTIPEWFCRVVSLQNWPEHSTASISLPSSHSESCCHLFPRHQHQPSTWSKRKRDSSDLATFFHCSVVTCPLCPHTYSKRWCTVCSDNFLSWPALSFSEIWSTQALLCDQNRWRSLCSPHALVSLGYSWSWSWFILPCTALGSY